MFHTPITKAQIVRGSVFVDKIDAEAAARPTVGASPIRGSRILGFSCVQTNGSTDCFVASSQ